MIIRQEKQDEFKAIYDLVKTAFATAKVADGDEQDYVDKLRAGGNYIPELALVAEQDKNLIGHIMLTNMPLKTSDGNLKTLLLAPLSVVLEYRSKGIGGALIKEAFRIALQMGYKAVFLCGDPAYYNRFGFKEAKRFSVKSNLDIPDQFFLACELEENALSNLSGTVDILT